MRIDRRMEGKESLGTYEVVIEMGWKTREVGDANESTTAPIPSPTTQRGRRTMRRTKAHGRRTRAPRQDEARDRIGEKRGEGRKCNTSQKSYRCDVEKEVDLGGRRNKT